MALDPNDNDWPPGQPPPWLPAYGPPPEQLASGSTLGPPPPSPVPRKEEPPPTRRGYEPIGLGWETMSPPTGPQPAPKKDDKKRIGEAGAIEETASSRDALMPLPADAPMADPYLAAMQGAAGGARPGFRVTVPQTPPPTSPTQTDPYFAAMQGGAVVSPSQLPGAGLAQNGMPMQGGAATHPGGQPLAPADEQRILAGMSPEDRLRFTKEITPEQRAAEIEKMSPAERTSAVNAMSPEEFLQFKSNYQAKLVAEEATRRAAIENENLRREQEAFFARQQAFTHAQEDTKALLVDAQRLANTKIDPDRLARNQGIGGSILSLIGSTIGGAMSQYTGGRNLALEQFSKRVDNDIEAQKADIVNGWRGIETRKGAIAAEFERHGEMYRAQETYRIAAYQTAINQLQTHLQQFDPQGATAMRTRDSIDQFHAAIQQHTEKLQQQFFDNRIKAAEADLKVRTEDAKERHDRAEEGIGWMNATTARDKAKQENKIHTPEGLRQTYGDAAVEDVYGKAGPRGPVTDAQFKAASELAGKRIDKAVAADERSEKKADKAQKAQVIVPIALNPNGTAHYEPLKQENGTPYQIPEGMEKDVHEKMSAHDRLLNEIDAMRMLRHDNSGHVAPGVESRKMAQHAAKALLDTMEASGLKRLSEEDVKVLHDVQTGGKDADAAFASIMENLDEYRNIVLADRKTVLPNFTGKLPDVPDPVAAKDLAKKNLDQPSIGETVPWTDPRSSWQQSHAGRKATGLTEELAKETP